MTAFASLTLWFAVAVVADDPGFGGAAPEPVDASIDAPIDAPVEEPLAPLPEFTGGGHAPSFPATPAETTPTTKKKTALEIDLEKARLDPANFPLIQCRVDVARVVEDLKDAEKRGLASVPELRKQLAATQSILDDVERIAFHRLNVCTSRLGIRSQTKNFKMTAAGPVRLTTQEMLASTSAVDPDGCARIELVDAAVVARVKRAHELRHILKTTTFPFHKLDDKRALQKEEKALLGELAKEDVPVLTVSGGKDPYGR